MAGFEGATRLRALIFDVDGTLADTERDGHRVAFNRAFADAGLDWHWSVALYGELLAVSGGKERIRYYVDQFASGNTLPAGVDELIPPLHAAKTRHFTRMLEEGRIPLRTGVKRLLEDTRRHDVRLAIATTTAPVNVVALLRHALSPEAPSWFDVIAAGDDAEEKKPAPDVYLRTLDALGAEAGECIAFEDSANGLASSAGAGVPTVVTVNEYTRAQRFDQALIVIDHLGEPDRPFTVLQGDAHGAACVDIALLRRLLAEHGN